MFKLLSSVFVIKQSGIGYQMQSIAMWIINAKSLSDVRIQNCHSPMKKEANVVESKSGICFYNIEMLQMIKIICLHSFLCCTFFSATSTVSHWYLFTHLKCVWSTFKSKVGVMKTIKLLK